MDLAQLPPEEASLFMEEFGVEELGLHKVIHQSYELLGQMSFFTVGEDEVRAWTVRRGASAIEAAGAIHTDLQKGFIRAEVIEYDTLLSLGRSGRSPCSRPPAPGGQRLFTPGWRDHARTL